MHALSKKHYYDVIKSGQEDTILESDPSNVDCEQKGAPTSEVGCYARTHLKTNAVQTQWSRNNKNFRNEYTLTSDDDSGAVSVYCPVNRECSIHHSRSYEDVATNRSRSSQATSTSHQHPLMPKTGKATIVVEHAAEYFELKKKGCAPEPKSTITAKGDDESTQYDCGHSKVRTSNFDEYQCIPGNRGLAACRTFSLGSPESRRLQNEHRNTKLIGGCRVPVIRNYKSNF